MHRNIVIEIVKLPNQFQVFEFPAFNMFNITAISMYASRLCSGYHGYMIRHSVLDMPHNNSSCMWYEYI